MLTSLLPVHLGLHFGGTKRYGLLCIQLEGVVVGATWALGATVISGWPLLQGICSLVYDSAC